jgi:cell division protein FtsB
MGFIARTWWNVNPTGEFLYLLPILSYYDMMLLSMMLLSLTLLAQDLEWPFDQNELDQSVSKTHALEERIEDLEKEVEHLKKSIEDLSRECGDASPK